MNDFQQRYDAYKSRIEDKLIELLPVETCYNKPLVEAMRYSLDGGGKRIRPVLLLAAYESAGGDANAHHMEDIALGFAAAIEYIHTYSLIHDDLPSMDDDDMRRGRPSLHKAYGEATAILAGDALLSRAFEVMSQLCLGHVSDVPHMLIRQQWLASKLLEDQKHIVRAMEVIADASGAYGMVGGQIADMIASPMGNADDDAALMYYIHSHKTGALISAAAHAGALIGGADTTELDDYVLYANSLGLAFQISDDLQDMDEEGGALNYPSVFGADKARQSLHTYTQDAIGCMAAKGERGTFLVELASRLEGRV